MRIGRYTGFDWKPRDAADVDDVRWAAQTILQRQAGDDLTAWCLGHNNFKSLVTGMLGSSDYKSLKDESGNLGGYRVPSHLSRESARPKCTLAAAPVF